MQSGFQNALWANGIYMPTPCLIVKIRDAPKWKFLAETEKEENKAETPEEIMPIISTIAFMAMTVY